MERSACELGLRLDPRHLPNACAVSKLGAAGGIGGDVRLRITLSGGLATATASSSVLWMSASPLPPPSRPAGTVITQSIEVAHDDPLARHKTLNYWRKRIAHALALEAGSDDVLCLTAGRLICETTRANVFLVEGDRLVTPGTEGPLLLGVMRGFVLDVARRIGLDVEERPVPLESLHTFDEAFLTNSVRGMLPVARLMSAEWSAPGPVTRWLWAEVLRWLESGGGAT
jgi:branched-subunit amino acid aminotransferase/4-amino-4-deoxychorismate lyase